MRSETLCRNMALITSTIVINTHTRITGRTVTPNKLSFHVRVMLSYVFLNTCNIAEQYTATFLASPRQMAITGVGVEKVPPQNGFSSASMPSSVFLCPFD
jgi:hypothetical protein